VIDCDTGIIIVIIFLLTLQLNCYCKTQFKSVQFLHGAHHVW